MLWGRFFSDVRHCNLFKEPSLCNQLSHRIICWASCISPLESIDELYFCINAFISSRLSNVFIQSYAKHANDFLKFLFMFLPFDIPNIICLFFVSYQLSSNLSILFMFFQRRFSTQARWLRPVVLTLGWERQKDCHEFKAILGYVVNSRPPCATVWGLVSKTKQQPQQEPSTVTTKQIFLLTFAFFCSHFLPLLLLSPGF